VDEFVHCLAVAVAVAVALRCVAELSAREAQQLVSRFVAEIKQNSKKSITMKSPKCILKMSSG
jgi:hypothetical protein